MAASAQATLPFIIKLEGAWPAISTSLNSQEPDDFKCVWMKAGLPLKGAVFRPETLSRQ
jgi:hypothetical protein